MKKTNTINITNGPSREELFDGLRLSSEKRLVPFVIYNNGEERFVAVFINSIEAEDGSGQSWNLNISIDKKFIFLDPILENANSKIQNTNFSDIKEIIREQRLGRKRDFLVEILAPRDRIELKAYYSSQTRKGAIIVNS